MSDTPERCGGSGIIVLNQLSIPREAHHTRPCPGCEDCQPATSDTPQPCDPPESDRKNDITADAPQERWPTDQASNDAVEILASVIANFAGLPGDSEAELEARSALDWAYRAGALVPASALAHVERKRDIERELACQRELDAESFRQAAEVAERRWDLAKQDEHDAEQLLFAAERERDGWRTTAEQASGFLREANQEVEAAEARAERLEEALREIVDGRADSEPVDWPTRVDQLRDHARSALDASEGE